MIIPIRCFTCGKVLADKWEFFQSELRSEKGNTEPTVLETTSKDIQKTKEGEILDKMGLHRYCCRRVMIGTVELIDVI